MAGMHGQLHLMGVRHERFDVKPKESDPVASDPIQQEQLLVHHLHPP